MRDLPPRRRPTAPAWTRPITERLTPAVKVLVIVETLVFFFYAFVERLQPFFREHLALGPGLFHGEIWQPLTAMLVHVDSRASGFFTLFMNLVGLWFVGAFIERTNGTRRFLQLFFTAGILSFVAMGLVGRLKLYDLGQGCSYAVLALFVAFGRMYDRSPAQILGGFVMQARYLAMLLVGFSVMVDLGRGDWASLAATLVASGVGYAMAGGGFGDLVASFRARRLRRRYRVLDGGQPSANPGGKSGGRPGGSSTKKKAQYWN